MGSLLKETDLADLHAWAEKYTTGTVHWSEKLDGFALSLTYVDGRFVRAVTRGDGEVGDDISANVLRMKNLPLHIDFMPVCHVRAEALIDLKTWADHFDGDANPRNSAAGTARRLSGEKCEHIMLIVHGVEYEDQKINAHFATESVRFAELSRLGFTLPASGSCHHTNLDPVLSNYEDNIRSSLGYEIDGIVVKSDDVIHAQELGDVDGRPRAARAWKFKSLSGVTELLGVEWQTGRTGVITPVGILKPVSIGGVVISRASLINFQEIQRLDIEIGADVIVARCQDVIPRVLGRSS
jgi:DNA ligase (NAD+)